MLIPVFFMAGMIFGSFGVLAGFLDCFIKGHKLREASHDLLLAGTWATAVAIFLLIAAAFPNTPVA